MGVGINSGTWFAPNKPPNVQGKFTEGAPINNMQGGIGNGSNWGARQNVMERNNYGVFSTSSTKMLADMKPYSVEAANLRRHQGENSTTQVVGTPFGKPNLGKGQTIFPTATSFNA